LKKVIFVFVLLAVLAFSAIPAQALEITSGAAVLIDMESGRVLYSQNPDQPLPPGGLNKLMTGLLAAENRALDYTVTLPMSYSPVSDTSPSGLKGGDSRTVEALLYAMLLHRSSNAAKALAIGVSDSEKNFTDLMNRRAAELGMKNTYWLNPYGTKDDGQLTTAYDLALLTRAVMQNEVFAAVMGTGYKVVPWGTAMEEYTHPDRTFLDTYKSFITGARTADRVGWADYCMVAAGEKSGVKLVGVIMGGSSNSGMYEEMLDLLNYGFNNYSLTKVGVKGGKLGTLDVVGGRAKTLDAVLAEDVSILLNRDNENPVKSISLPQELKAPIAKGDVIGSVTYADGEFEITVDLIAAESVPRHVFWETFWQALKRIFSVWIK